MEEVGSLPTMDYKEVNPSYIEKDYVDHRQVYVGLHHRGAEKPHTRKKQPKLSITRPPQPVRWDNGKKSVVVKEDDDTNTEDEGGAGGHLPYTVPASERVKFILGGEEEKQVQETPQLFTELEELFVYLDGNTEWKETARWYKYEEDVEEGGDRWSKPHVATLSLCSLFELRRSLMAGTVVLDMEATSLDEIADNVLDNLISCNKLDKDFRLKVRETLLCKHRHHRDAGFRRNLSNIINRNKSVNSLHTSSSAKLCKTVQNTNGHDSNTPAGGADNSTDDTPQTKIKMFRNYSQPAFPTSIKPQAFERSISSVPSQRQLSYNSPPNASDDEGGDNKTPGFLKRLPSNAEASNILVGEVDFLDKPITAFVRLSTSCIIGDLTEVPIPTRFVFVMLGPAVSHGRYHEIGRAISTLMADEIFHDVVYRAKSRDDLIAGIEEFLEHVTVLPPGEWDPSIRLDPRLHNYPKVSRRIAMDSRLETPMEQGEGVSEGDCSSDSEKSHLQIKITTRAFGGVVRDFQVWKGRKRDIRDGINLKCLGAVFFIYLLLIAVIATIGEHNWTSSGKYMGTREHLLSLFITGILFSVFGGQPLLVISLELPLSIFDALLYNICTEFDIDFLPFRLWIGLWTVVFLVVFIALDVNWYLRYITRFTLEVFVMVPPLVLFLYGFVHMCRMLKAYSDLPGTFENLTCLCLRPMTQSLNVTSALLATTLGGVTATTLSFNATTALLNTTNGLAGLTTTSATTIANATTTILSTMLPTNATLSTLTTAAATTTTTAAKTVAGTVLTTVYERVDNIHFRDCVANHWVLRGSACDHGVYPFTSMLILSTIVLVVLLTSFQHLGYLPKMVNQLFHNFAALLVVIILSVVANQFNINIRYLQIPKSLNEMNHRTTWFVDPLGGNEAWTVILALIPAFLLTLFVFVEQQLTGCYINHKNKVLKKGHGYHFDILVIAVGMLFSSLLGLPFCVASIFVSIIHVQSLTVKESVNDCIGYSMNIKEQRLTSFLVYILIILTPTMRPILMYIPFPVLYGLLIVAMFKTFSGVQFVKRFTLMFMPKDKQPDIVYLRQVPLISANILTVVQVIVIVLLCAVRGTVATIVLPFMIILVIFLRFLLEKILPLRDILAMDEAVPAIRCSWRHCQKGKGKNIESVERGVLLADESHEDVLPDHNKDIDRVNIFEELGAWKQPTYSVEHSNNATPNSNNSPNENTDSKKRRKKRSRGSLHGSTNKDLQATGAQPKPRTADDEKELVELKPVVELSSTEHNPFFDGLKASSSEVRKVSSSKGRKASSNEGRKAGSGALILDEKNPDRTSPELLPIKETTLEKSSSHNRKNSEDRRKKSDRGGDLVKRNSSKDRNTPKRHDFKERNSMKRQASHDRKHKTSNTNRPPKVVDDTALPPWEQPYHSPPRRDLGLLHAQLDNGITPSYSRDGSIASGRGPQDNANNIGIPTISFRVPSEDECPMEILTNGKTNKSHSPVEDSGDAGSELSGL